MIANSNDEVRKAREDLLRIGLHDVRFSSDLVPNEIERSWRRSASLKVQPDAEPRLVTEIDPEATLLRVANPVLDQWQASLADANMTIVLADHQGWILGRRGTSAQSMRLLDRVHAAEGFDFSETSLGTNGLGTPVESQDAVYVHGAAHFNESLSDLTCAGAPLRHPLTGRIMGSISLAAPSRSANELMLSMTRQLARQISDEIEVQADSHALELARMYRRWRSAGHQVAVVSSQIVMAGQAVLPYIGPEEHGVIWDCIHRNRSGAGSFDVPVPGVGIVRVLGRSGHAYDSIWAIEFVSQGETESIDRLSADQPFGGKARANRDDGIWKGAKRGFDIRWRDEADEITRQSSDAYVSVRRDLGKAVAQGGVVQVSGRPGAGRRYQATAWITAETGKAPMLIESVPGRRGMRAEDCPDPDQRPGEQTIVAEVERALAAGHSVVVGDSHMLSRRDRSRLVDVWDRENRRGTDRQLLFLVELTDCAEELRFSEARTIVPKVEVPSLEEVPTALPHFIRSLGEEILLRDSPLKFSSAALRALMAWHWPGNVPELIETLKSADHAAGGGAIDVDHLPQQIQRATRASLSRYERSERSAIESALADAGGNKARAAELLGIGRTTLYRKLRALKIDG